MLSIPSWDPSLSVGNGKIDQQHRELLALGRTAIYLLKNQYDPLYRRQITGTLDEILTLTVSHFATEEQILARNGCPTLAEHKEQHEKHLNILRELMTSAKQSRIDGLGFTRALVASLYRHMHEWDMACQEFIRDQSD